MLRKLTALIFLALGCISTISAFAEQETAAHAFKHQRITGAVYAMTNAAAGNEIIIAGGRYILLRQSPGTPLQAEVAFTVENRSFLPIHYLLISE